MDRTGIENQSQLRSATNAAVRANMAIYTMGIRGLQALVPGGEAAERQPARDVALLGQVRRPVLSHPTRQPFFIGHSGRRLPAGKAFLDSNDFGKVFTGVQQQLALLSARLPQLERYGAMGNIRITVRVNRPGLKSTSGAGHHAPRPRAFHA